MTGVRVSTHVQARSHLGRFLAEYNANAVRAVTETAEEGARLAREFAPRDTGELGESIHAIPHGKSATIVAGTGHAAPQEFGAGPHAIPNAFGWGDGFGIAPDFHPGNPATHFMKRARDAIKDRFVRSIRQAIP